LTPKEIKAVVKTMRSSGVKRLKTADFEIDLSDAPARTRKKRITPEEEQEIKHKLEQMKSVMSLGDEELLDRLFPDHQPQDEEAPEVKQ
jgi:hypothetical protein